MTRHSEICNYWTWKSAPDGKYECQTWRSITASYESEGVYSSEKKCPCYLNDMLFIGIIEDTFYAAHENECAASCKDLPNCNYWSWIRYDCNLYKTVNEWQYITSF